MRCNRRRRGFGFIEFTSVSATLGVVTLIAGTHAGWLLGRSGGEAQVEQVKSVAENAQASRAIQGMAAPYTCEQFSGAIKDQHSTDALVGCGDEQSASGEMTRGTWSVVFGADGHMAVVHYTSDGSVIAYRWDPAHPADTVTWAGRTCPAPVAATAIEQPDAKPC